MFTFGYKNRINGPLRALIALAVGVVMVANPTEALAAVVKVIAAFLIASGLVSLFVGLKDKQNGSLPLMSFNALIDVLLGLLLFIFPGFVAKFIIYLIGFVLLAFGGLQILALIGIRRSIGLGAFAFIIPAMVTFAGAFILFNPFAEEVMVTIAGVSLIIYGASELFSSWKMKKAMRDDVTGNSHSEIKDVDFEKVDDQVDEQ